MALIYSLASGWLGQEQLSRTDPFIGGKGEKVISK
jgi:hypothetical protein